MTRETAPEAFDSRSCAAPGCTAEATGSRGVYSRYCSAHKGLASAALAERRRDSGMYAEGRNQPRERRASARPGAVYATRARGLVKIGEQVDRTRARRDAAELEHAAALRLWRNALRALIYAEGETLT